MVDDSMFAGLTEFLESKAEVKNVTFTPGKPVASGELSAWERKQQCALPKDLKQLYLSMNGFTFKWSYQYNDVLMPLGEIHISSLSQLRPLHIHGEEKSDPVAESSKDGPSLLDLDLCNAAGETWKPSFGGGLCKIFSLDYCPTRGDVCLVSSSESGRGGVWLLDLSLSWHYLCPSLSDYLRLAVVHLGLFQWPYLFTPFGLSHQYQKWFHLFIPKSLEQDTGGAHDHTHSHTSSAQGPGAAAPAKHELNSLDVSRVLFSKSLRGKRPKVTTTTSVKKSTAK